MKILIILFVFLLSNCGHSYKNYYENDDKFNREELIKNDEGIVVFNGGDFDGTTNLDYLDVNNTKCIYNAVFLENDGQLQKKYEESQNNINEIKNGKECDNNIINSFELSNDYTNIIKAKAGKYVLHAGLFLSGLIRSNGLTAMDNLSRFWYKESFPVPGIAYFELKPGEVIYLGQNDYTYNGELLINDDFNYIKWRLSLSYNHINEIIEKRIIKIAPLPKECDFFDFYNTDYEEYRKTYPKKFYTYQTRVNKHLTLSTCKPKLLEIFNSITNNSNSNTQNIGTVNSNLNGNLVLK